VRSRPRNGGLWTEARYWQFIRSTLRRASLRWGPIGAARKAARRPLPDGGRRKWEYRCSACGCWHHGNDVQVDHILPLGSLTCPGDLPGFVERLFCEVEGLRVLCSSCHDTRHAEGAR